MSGHSKWSTIKHKKAATDKKKADIFSKLAKAITIAARQGGGDPEMNYALRGIMEKAKSANMPKDKIEKSIIKGVGSGEGEQLEELLIEAYGPGGVAILIKAITDNRNRTNSELKHLLSQKDAKPTGEGAVKWMFEEYGFLKLSKDEVDKKDEFELEVIDLGIEDVKWEEGSVILYTKVVNMKYVLKFLNDKFKDIKTGLEWVPKNPIDVSEGDKKKLETLYESLDEHDDVQEIYSNTK